MKSMVAVAENLTVSEFQLKFAEGDRSYEYWYGQAIPKGMRTWIHGLLQRIVMELLTEAGYIAGSEVELESPPMLIQSPTLSLLAAKLKIRIQLKPSML